MRSAEPLPRPWRCILLISNPAAKAKSFVLSDEGVRRSRELFEQFFVLRQPWRDQPALLAFQQ